MPEVLIHVSITGVPVAVCHVTAGICSVIIEYLHVRSCCNGPFGVGVACPSCMVCLSQNELCLVTLDLFEVYTRRFCTLVC